MGDDNNKPDNEFDGLVGAGRGTEAAKDGADLYKEKCFKLPARLLPLPNFPTIADSTSRSNPTTANFLRTHRRLPRAFGVAALFLAVTPSLLTAFGRVLPTAAAAPTRGSLVPSDLNTAASEGGATAIGRVPKASPPQLQESSASVSNRTALLESLKMGTAARSAARARQRRAQDVPADAGVHPLFVATPEEKAKEREVLVRLYEATGGEEWGDKSGWLQGDPCGRWYGVNCNFMDYNYRDYVRYLDLSGNMLAGPIPTEIGELTKLVNLGLHDNALTGPIPTEIGELTKLQWLDLYSNTLTGPIPTEIKDLTQLRFLYLPNNTLTGLVPTEIGNLLQLRHLILHENKLVGTIPEELGRLGNLNILNVGGNFLTGSMPESVCKLRRGTSGDGNLENLKADCGGDTPEVQCSCCTSCSRASAARLARAQLALVSVTSWQPMILLRALVATAAALVL